MEDLVLTPYAPNLVEATRSIGYSFETALADIIDNSISNLATRIDVKFSNENNPFVAVIDNGVGMAKSSLENAMRYGSSSSLDERSELDLGRFGLGLKMASMSQCRKLTVITKVNGNLSAACWDLDYIRETENWSLIRFSEEQAFEIDYADYLYNYSSGTVVVWENLDRISESEFDFRIEFNEKLSYSEKHMSLVFHRFLENTRHKQHFELYFNNRQVIPIDPYFKSNPASQKVEEETLFIDGAPMKITPYILPYASKLLPEERFILDEYSDLNLKQGLYIYRNNRLIVWGKWFYLLRDNELNRLAKICVDLPNSVDTQWTIDVKKSSAQIPSSIKKQLRKIVLHSVGKSEKVFKYRGRKILNTTFNHIWNKVDNRGKVQYLVNRDIPMFQIFQESLDDEQFRLFDGLVKSLEDGFPFDSVYYEKASDSEFDDKQLEQTEVYDIAKLTIQELDGTPKERLRIISNIDIFQKYPEVIEQIEKEMEYDE